MKASGWANILEFIQITDAFARSAQELLDASMLVDDDPIKADMVKHLAPEFDALMAKEAHLHLIMKNKDYDREMVLTEMQACTRMANELTTRIREKLEPLIGFSVLDASKSILPS